MLAAGGGFFFVLVVVPCHVILCLVMSWAWLDAVYQVADTLLV